MSTTRATAWSVTLNNPTASDEECINVARQKGWKVEGQLERGASGTPHYQLMVTTPQVRASAVKRAFPRAHIEVARNAAALKQYVHKDETAEGDLPTQQEMYPSLSRFWDLITEQFQFDYTGATGNPCSDPRNCENHWFSLRRFDDWCSHLIMKGYNIETMAVNPQTRSAWSRYAVAIVYRSIDRQDRQTTENLVAEVNIPVVDGFSSSCNEASSPRTSHEEGRSVHEPARFCE